MSSFEGFSVLYNMEDWKSTPLRESQVKVVYMEDVAVCIPAGPE